MLTFRVCSRTGNWVLAVLGAVYVIAATLLLVVYVITTWNGRSLVDDAFQFALVVCVFGGLTFIRIAVRNLTIPPSA